MSRKTRRNAPKNDATLDLRTAINRLSYSKIASGMALGSMAFSGQVLAADAAATPASDAGLEEIVVTGIRASLQKSLDVKREAIGVVDAISAEDIGKFPDSNLATAMQRIPGVTVTRSEANVGGVSSSAGAATQITVRGFGPEFNQTLYDGRQVPTSTGNRGFNFGAVGSDFVSQVDVLKTPDATLSSGAIGATVNIKYPTPFEHPGLQVAGSVSGTDSEGGSATPNGSILVSNTFADDRFGILADVAYNETKVRGNHVDIQGWEGGRGDGVLGVSGGTGLSPCQLRGAGPCAIPPGTNANPATIKDWFIQDYGIYQEHTDDKRIGGRIALQAKPVDGLVLTLDDNYSKETITQVQQGFSVWFNNGTLTDVVQAPDGSVTSFTQPNSPTDFQAAINGAVVEDNTLGLNVKWDYSAHASFLFDASTGTSKLNPGGQLSELDTDVGYGNSPANNTSVGIVVGGGKNLPYPVGYGPSGNAANFLDPAIIGSHVLVEDYNQNEDKLNQFKLQGDWHEENLQFKYGVQYSHEDFELREYTDLPYTWQMYAGYGPTPIGTGGVSPIPANLVSGSYNTGSGFINGWNNGGNLPAAILAADGQAIKNYLEGLKGAGMNIGACSQPSGVPINCTGKYIMYPNAGANQDVTESIVSPYLNLTSKTKIAEMPLTINLGARYDITHVDSSGLSQLPTGMLTILSTDKTAYNVNYTPTVAVTTKSEYRYLLPNIDLNLDVTDQVKARIDLSRTLTRPQLINLTPDLNVPAGQRVGGLTATGGNPDLLPFLSDNLDFGAEWYYARNSYLSADAFVKEVSNFIVGGTRTANINGVTLPDGSLAQFNITSQVNGPSAEVRGIELAVQHMFWDTGFGFQANATFVSTNKPYDPNDLSTSGFAVTGLANSYNFVPFYDKYGLNVRVAINHRAEYLDKFGQHQPNSAFGAEPVFVNAATYVDLSASYEITKHFNVYFEALNLTDQAYSTHGRFEEQVLDVVDTGRQYTLGVHFKL
jgi:iron complex outermembrane recepter protein